MQETISRETPFKALHNAFTVGATSAGYTLSYSTSKEGPWTNYTENTPANEVLIVNGVTPFMWFRLTGNVDDDVELIK